MKSICKTGLLILLMQVPLVSLAAEDLANKKVLALYWYGKDFPLNVDFDRGVQKALQSARIEYHAEYFEPNFFPGDAQADSLRDYLKRKYSDRAMDAVVAMGWPAADFLLKYRDDIFPNVPMVFHTASRSQFLERAAGMNAAGVVPDDFMTRTLGMALQLHPGTERVFVINGTPEKDKSVEAFLKEQFRDFESRVKITYLTDRPLDNLLEEVKSLPERSLIIYSRQDYEEPGLSLSIRDVLSLIASEAKAPIYGSGTYTGLGNVGGYAVNVYECGFQAGRLALRLLNGDQPKDLPIVEVPSVPTFDWRQFDRWKIAENRLPPGSDIRFKELTLFQQYKWQIIGALALCIVQFCFIAGLLAERQRRRIAQAKVLERLKFERLLANLSADFTSLPASKVDHAIETWLQRLAEFLGADSGNLLKVPGSGGLTPSNALEDLALAIPIHVDDSIWMFTFRASQSFRVSPEDLVPRIRLAGEILAGALVRKANSEALRESQQRYALATTSGRVVVWDWDLKTSEFYADPLLKSLLGYEDHEIGNHFDDWLRLVHPDDVNFMLERLRSHVDSGAPQFEVEHRFVRKDGSIRWFLMSGSVVRSDQGVEPRMVGTGTDITQRKLAEQEAQLLSTRLLDAQDQERRRIARELHDGTAQNLCTVLFNLEMLESTLKLPVHLEHTISDCRTFCTQALNEIRTLSYILHPPMLDFVGLSSSLRWYLEGFSRRTGIDVQLTASPDIGRLPVKIETDLFRIVQECLANIHRHSGSRTAQVRLELRETEVVLQVEDQGCGMPSPAAAGENTRQPGVGLSGMDQRLRFLGGYMEVQSSSHGTTITASVPLPREAETAEKTFVARSM
jgi:PAS domain S-box-containing protein